MPKQKHNPNASGEIDNYIATLPAWSKKICEKLRSIALKSDEAIIEDWKWGPNYYCNGMVFGFAAHQKFVNFVFFKGVLLKDKKKILVQNSVALNTRHIKFSDVTEINEDLLLEYIFEAIDNNKKGKKLLINKDKTVVITADVKKAFSQSGVLISFGNMNYSRRKDFMFYINAAKKPETRIRRIDKVIAVLKKKYNLIHSTKRKWIQANIQILQMVI